MLLLPIICVRVAISWGYANNSISEDSWIHLVFAKRMLVAVDGMFVVLTTLPLIAEFSRSLGVLIYIVKRYAIRASPRGDICSSLLLTYVAVTYMPLGQYVGGYCAVHRHICSALVRR